MHLALVTVVARGGVFTRVWRPRWAPLLLCLRPLAGMCVPAGGVVGTECGRGARDTVLSTPYASPLPPAGANIPSWPGLGALYVYVLCACRPAVGSCGPPARARLPLAGGRLQNKNGGSRCADTGRAEWTVSRILPPQHETDHHYICALARRPLGFPPPTEGWWGDR